MSASTEVENMRLFGSVMSKMMGDMIEVHPAEAEEYIDTLEAMFLLFGGQLSKKTKKTL